MYAPSVSVELTPVTTADIVSRLYVSFVPDTVALVRRFPATSEMVVPGTTVRPTVSLPFFP